MERVYECEASKKADVMKILEADPYKEGSFARVGYKVKDGATIEEEGGKTYVYISASEDFVKKADELLKDLATPMKEDDAKRISKKISDEEEAAGAGVGSIFG